MIFFSKNRSSATFRGAKDQYFKVRPANWIVRPLVCGCIWFDEFEVKIVDSGQFWAAVEQRIL